MLKYFFSGRQNLGSTPATTFSYHHQPLNRNSMENRIFSVSPFVGAIRKSSPRIWNFFAVQFELALFSKLQIPSPQHQWRINWKFSLGTEFARLPNLIRGWDGTFPAPVETQKSAELSAIWRWLRRRQMIIMFEYVKPYSRARRSHRSWRLDSRLWSITLRSHESCRWHCELFSSCRLPRSAHPALAQINGRRSRI